MRSRKVNAAEVNADGEGQSWRLRQYLATPSAAYFGWRTARGWLDREGVPTVGNQSDPHELLNMDLGKFEIHNSAAA